jgi:beta-phosphoglucomutase-like phosphatase (HAD superfamily)
MVSVDTYQQLNDIIDERLGKNFSIVFDMDGTLIESDVANNLAYQKAYQMKYGSSACLMMSGRITRERLQRELTISENDMNEIIAFKQQVLYSYIHCTKATKIYDFAKSLLGKFPLYLATSAHADRVSLLLNYYHMADMFEGIVCGEEVTSGRSKFDVVMEKYNLDPSRMIVFENSQKEIDEAMRKGVQTDCIVKPKLEVLMNSFQLLPNSFLKSSVIAFYSCAYTRMGQPGNPDYLNYLKNQMNNFSQNTLLASINMLRDVLLLDIPAIYEQIGKCPLVVCVIPRAGALSSYAQNQLLFIRTVSDVINQLQTKYQFINGTTYIQRHTSTMTTHLEQTSWHPTGDMCPFPGITKATCHISSQVKGQDILLVDDIYTPGVNIDEDAIQALLDEGAKSVTFYAIGRV